VRCYGSKCGILKDKTKKRGWDGMGASIGINSSVDRSTLGLCHMLQPV